MDAEKQKRLSYFVIDRDLLEIGGIGKRRGKICCAGYPIAGEKIEVAFRTYTDDDELVYEGRYYCGKEDDGYCDTQEAVLEFAMADAGCTRITVFRDGKWIQEIG